MCVTRHLEPSTRTHANTQPAPPPPPPMLLSVRCGPGHTSALLAPGASARGKGARARPPPTHQCVCEGSGGTQADHGGDAAATDGALEAPRGRGDLRASRAEANVPAAESARAHACAEAGRESQSRCCGAACLLPVSLERRAGAALRIRWPRSGLQGLPPVRQAASRLNELCRNSTSVSECPDGPGSRTRVSLERSRAQGAFACADDGSALALCILSTGVLGAQRLRQGDTTGGRRPQACFKRRQVLHALQTSPSHTTQDAHEHAYGFVRKASATPRE